MAADPQFLAGVLDLVMADEPLLIAFAAEAGHTPEAVVQACRLDTATGCAPTSLRSVVSKTLSSARSGSTPQDLATAYLATRPIRSW